MDKKVSRLIAQAALIRQPPEIAVSPKEGGGWIVLIDNVQAGHVFQNKAGAETVAEWLAALFDEFGRPLIVGGKGRPVC